MQRTNARATIVLLVFVLGILWPSAAHGQATVKAGPRVGVPIGDVSDLGGNLHLGAGARVGLSALPDGVVFNPSFDVYLTDDYLGASLTVFAVDLNGLYEIPLDGSPVVPYAGGGLAVTRISIDSAAPDQFGDPSSTEVGLNLLGGARFPLGAIEPFAEFNFTAGAERIGITGGVLFAF